MAGSLYLIRALGRISDLICEIAARQEAIGMILLRLQMPLTQEQTGDCTRLTPVHVIAFYSACVAKSRLKQKVPPYAFPAGRRSKTQATSVLAISIWPPSDHWCRPVVVFGSRSRAHDRRILGHAGIYWHRRPFISRDGRATPPLCVRLANPPAVSRPSMASPWELGGYFWLCWRNGRASIGANDVWPEKSYRDG
jgi:hypothetical protein